MKPCSCGIWLVAIAASVGLAQQTDFSGDNREFHRRAAAIFHDRYFFHRWDESEHTVDGEDWSLPRWVRAASYSGIQVPEKFLGTDFPGPPQRQVILTWRELDPVPGRYEFEAAPEMNLGCKRGEAV